MKKLFSLFVIFNLLLTMGCASSGSAQGINTEKGLDSKYDINAKRDILFLMMAYPGCIKYISVDTDDKVYIVMKSGKRILYDDKKSKTPEEKLANPDLQDMLETQYPLSDTKSLMNENYDPGRARVYDFFKEIYGGSKESIQRNLTGVRVGKTSYSFNKKSEASIFLEKAVSELLPLTKNNKNIYSYVFPISGTFNYRVIAGTNQLSAHSFGIAIDLAGNRGGYWRWISRKEGQIKLNPYPREIVRIFEKNNFIWGGKWGHFDIMHFEYRPEIILKAKYFKYDQNAGETWYNGIPVNNTVQGYIAIINKAFKR